MSDYQMYLAVGVTGDVDEDDVDVDDEDENIEDSAKWTQETKRGLTEKYEKENEWRMGWK